MDKRTICLFGRGYICSEADTDSSGVLIYLGVVPGVADGEGPMLGEDLEQPAGDGDGLLLGHLGVDPPYVHRPLPREVPAQHLPCRPSEPTPAAATSEELHAAAAASVAARSLGFS